MIVSLEQCPKTFDRVRISIAISPVSLSVFNRTILIAQAREFLINTCFVRHNKCFSIYILCHLIKNDVCLTGRNMKGFNLSASLCHSHNKGFLLKTIFANVFTANIGFTTIISLHSQVCWYVIVSVGMTVRNEQTSFRTVIMCVQRICRSAFY